MMPDRYIAMATNMIDVLMTAVGLILLFLPWGAILVLMNLMVLVFFWLPTIYHKNVKRHHGGSWRAYLLDIWRIITNRYKKIDADKNNGK